MNRILFTLLSGDLLFLAIAFFLGTLLRLPSLESSLEYITSSPTKLFIFACSVMLSSYFSELYRLDRFYRKRELFFRSFCAMLASYFVLSGTFYLLPGITIGRGILIISIAFFTVLQCLWHICFKYFLKIFGMVPKVIVLGTGKLGRCIGELIVEHNRDHVLAGYVHVSDNGNECVVDNDLVLGVGEELYNIAKQSNSSKIIISVMERRGCLPVSELLKCKFKGVQVVDAISFYEKLTGKILVENINPGWFIFSEGFRITWIKSFMKYKKRCLDFVVSLIGLALVSPLLPIIYLAIKIESPGPAIFKQTRVGQNEKKFTIYKFRTMCNGAEDESGAVWAQKDDPRITRLGHFLRKSRLDELPQLFNVLMGDMSFSGPRPERPEFVEELQRKIPYYSNRHSVKPGVTGWAQIKYPYGASVEDALEKLKYDLFYIKNYSILLDFFIIMETFKVVFARRGAR